MRSDSGSKWSMRKRFLYLGLAAIAIGAFVLIYRGPGRAIVRGNIGDVAAAMLVYASLGAIWLRGNMFVRGAIAFAFATAVELGQAWWHVHSTAGDLLMGDTCDPWDIVAYAAGACVGLVWERIAVARCAACAPCGSSS
jgi:hypothetical protein